MRGIGVARPLPALRAGGARENARVQGSSQHVNGYMNLLHVSLYITERADLELGGDP